MKRAVRSRWFLPSLLLGVYLFIKLQGWMYARGVIDLERQLEEIRPVLAANVQREQLEKTRQAALQATQRVEAMDLGGKRLLQGFSQDLPASITLRRVQLRADGGLRIEGAVLPGIRTPESILVPWAQKLQLLQPGIRIRELVPLSQRPALEEAPPRASAQPAGAWNFNLEAESR